MAILDPEPFKLSNVFKFWPVIGNIISNDQNNKLQMQLQEDAQQWNQEQTDIAWQRGLEQWYRENEYNSPVEQMNRLREAGINPALAYSNGVMNQAGTSPDSPVPAPARAAPTQAFQMDPLTFANIGLIDAQREKLNAEADAIGQKLPEEVNQLRLQNANIQEDTNRLNEECSKLRQEIANLKEEQKLTAEKTISESFGRSMATKEFEIRSKESVAVVKELYSRIRVNNADAELKNSVQRLNVQQFNYLEQANAKMLLGLDLDNELKKSTSSLQRMQSALLGFDVADGYLNYKENVQAINDFKGDRGKFQQLRIRYVKSALWGVNKLISPVKGIISLGGKF